jgi:hypothetical protein
VDDRGGRSARRRHRPAVIDLLNVEPSFDHHYRAYGAMVGRGEGLHEQGIMDWMGRRSSAR